MKPICKQTQQFFQLFFILQFKSTQNFYVFIDDRFGETKGDFAGFPEVNYFTGIAAKKDEMKTFVSTTTLITFSFSLPGWHAGFL